MSDFNSSEIPNSSDCISRQAAKDMIKNHKSDFSTEKDYRVARACVNAVTSAQPERLTDDDFETIRIHLNAFKETLCNQRRWKEAEEYQHLIDRFMAFASTQPERKTGHVTYSRYCEELWGQSSICSLCGASWQIADKGDDNFCPNCGADMRGDNNGSD